MVEFIVELLFYGFLYVCDNLLLEQREPMSPGIKALRMILYLVWFMLTILLLLTSMWGITLVLKGGLSWSAQTVMPLFLVGIGIGFSIFFCHRLYRYSRKLFCQK